MACNLAVAAAAAGLNKSTVRAGRISGTRNELGGWQVEPADVAAATEGTSAADERLAEVKAALESMRQQRDKWQAQAERLAGMARHRPRPWWAFTDASKL
jgi:hypothetical protein